MPTQLIAGVLKHFACYLQTGSAQAGHRAALLLERLALDQDIDVGVREHSEELAEAIQRTLDAV